MALCLAESLIEKVDPVDQLQRYLRWYQEGYLSVNGHCIDLECRNYCVSSNIEAGHLFK